MFVSSLRGQLSGQPIYFSRKSIPLIYYFNVTVNQPIIVTFASTIPYFLLDGPPQLED